MIKNSKFGGNVYLKRRYMYNAFMGQVYKLR